MWDKIIMNFPTSSDGPGLFQKSGFGFSMISMLKASCHFWWFFKMKHALKNHQKWQNFSKKWRKALLNLHSTHFSHVISDRKNPNDETPVHHYLLLPTRPYLIWYSWSSSSFYRSELHGSESRWKIVIGIVPHKISSWFWLGHSLRSWLLWRFSPQ